MTAPDGATTARYLVIVTPSEPALFEYLAQRFRHDPDVLVLVDRRRHDQQARVGTDRRRDDGRRADRPGGMLGFGGVRLVRRGERTPVLARGGGLRTVENEGEAVRMGEMTQMGDVADRDVLEDRQRVDRWLEEGQYLIGRIIPAFLDDRERLRGRLEAAEQDCERLRLEVNELRKEVSVLQTRYRSEQSAIADAFGGVMDLLGQLHKPLADINRRLQPVHLATTSDSTP